MDLVCRGGPGDPRIPHQNLWQGSTTGSLIPMIELITIILIGVIIADLVSQANVKGTTTILCQLGNLWGVSVSGMLGQSYQTKKC